MDPLIEIFGTEFTVMVWVEETEQPFPSKPVTVYAVVLPGDTVIEVAVDPLLQL